MDTPDTPAYRAYAYDAGMPWAERLDDALTMFQARTGQAPRGVVVPQATVVEAQTARPELVVDGRIYMQPGHVYVW